MLSVVVENGSSPIPCHKEGEQEYNSRQRTLQGITKMCASCPVKHKHIHILVPPSLQLLTYNCSSVWQLAGAGTHSLYRTTSVQ